MTIVRREHRAHFTIVPNAVFSDKRLSLEAKGVLGYLLSRPHKWHVRLEHVGRTLLVGRRKLQRIFRELIGTGYVTREPQRLVAGHRFGPIDYVVRDVPVPVDKCRLPRVRKGPAVPRVQKGPAYKDSPWGPNGPAYKETYKERTSQRSSTTPPAWQEALTVPHNQRAQVSEEDARLDIEIVQLFDDVREGWQVLAALPDEVAARLRERHRRGELDRVTICELRNRFRQQLR